MNRFQFSPQAVDDLFEIFPQTDPLRIIRVLHGSRDILAILGEPKQ
jgi:hypothetical protein